MPFTKLSLRGAPGTTEGTTLLVGADGTTQFWITGSKVVAPSFFAEAAPGSTLGVARSPWPRIQSWSRFAQRTLRRLVPSVSPEANGLLRGRS